MWIKTLAHLASKFKNIQLLLRKSNKKVPQFQYSQVKTDRDVSRD